jgi:subtilase family serine protease
MGNLSRGTGRRVRRAATAALVCLLIGCGAYAQAGGAKGPRPRIQGEIEDAQRMVVPGTHSPLARAEFEAGRVPANTKLEGMTIVLGRSAAQEADLQALLAAQQDPNSTQYHKWLTSDEFSARFGVADADAAKIEFWLQQQGFTLQGRSRSNDRIQFSGTVQQVGSTFGTEMHYYQVAGTKHFAPSTDLSVPVAMGPMVQAVTNLSTFRPKAHIKYPAAAATVRPDFTSSQTQNHFLTPKDVATIYDLTPAYNAGLTGTGQSIAIMGQSSIVVSDIENFQNAAGLPKKDPTIVQVPNSGTAAVSTGDESESDLDLEYSGGMAPGATIIFVFVGNNKNFGVFDSLTFAIENQTAPVISISYGTCESDLGTGEYAALNGTLARAAAQGQSVIGADGDNGSEDCSGNKDQTMAEQQALAVDFPSSSQWVTGMGGTEFPTADVVSSNTTFWTAANGSDVISSAKSYIPETVWNDDIAATATVPGTLSSGGGGVSTLTPRPTWQTGVPGIPSGNFRFVPDISLTASPNNAGFLYCSSDTADTKITGSCTPSNGFRDASNINLTVAGGTSFDAPIFAGMVAIINQKTNSSGQGVVNPTLYMLASNAATYASAFHDITVGSNKCTAGTALCSTAGAGSFSATTGFDEASGLGSIDFFNLLSAWPGSSTPSSVASTTTLSAATLTPTAGASDVITIMVASGSNASTTTPTGTLTVAVDGTTQTSTLALVSGAATFTFTSATAGAHTISATYSGDATYASSSGMISVTVGGASAKSFSLTASNTTVAAGGSGTSTITVTPQNGYTGTIAFTVTSSPVVANACFAVPNVTVSGTTAVTAMMTVKTSSSLCGTGAMIGKAEGTDRNRDGWWANVYGWTGGNSGRFNLVAVSGLALSCIFLVGMVGLRSRRRGLIGAALIFVAVVAGVSGCGGGGSAASTSTNGSVNAAKGTYMLTVTGTDSTAGVKASGTLTLTID